MKSKFCRWTSINSKLGAFLFLFIFATSARASNRTGINANFGYHVKVSEFWGVGLRINYSTTSYNESLINGVTYSTISNNKTYLYPSLASTLEF